MNSPAASKNHYAFVTRWVVDATAEEVADIFEDAASLERWFPAVFLESVPREAVPGQFLGRRVDVRVKGWMPHTLGHSSSSSRNSIRTASLPGAR